MSKTVPFLTIILFLILSISKAAGKDWTYETVNFESHCLNKTETENKTVDIKVRPVRIQPGVYALNGTINVAIDLDGLSYEVEIKASYSSSGSSQYIPTPFQIPKCSLRTFMNIYYRKFAMDVLSECVNNLESFKGIWKGPFKSDLYVLNKCVLKTDEMPSKLAYGFYKLRIHLFGPLVDCEVAWVAKINRKM